MFIAHRGLYNNLIRENTLSAFDNAFNRGYDGVELDVRLTKDNIPVVIHDAFLCRVSDGFGLVKNYTYDELLKLNFGIKNIERIALLSDVINRYVNRIFFIELKEKVNISKYLNNKNTYYIASFNYDYIKDIPKDKNYKLGVISYVLNNDYDFNNIDFLMIPDFISSNEIINKLKAKNIETVIYAVGKNINQEYDKKLKFII